MGIGLRMLKGVIPQRELPGWFEVAVETKNEKTTLSLGVKIDGQIKRIEKTLDQDGATVMDLVGLWPDVADQVPGVARRFLQVIPVPRQCTILGAPVPDASTPTKEVARLTLKATVFGKTIERHFDSTLDRLYMADLVEMAEWLRDIQRQTEAAAQSEEPKP